MACNGIAGRICVDEALVYLDLALYELQGVLFSEETRREIYREVRRNLNEEAYPDGATLEDIDALVASAMALETVSVPIEDVLSETDGLPNEIDSVAGVQAAIVGEFQNQIASEAREDVRISARSLPDFTPPEVSGGALRLSVDEAIDLLRYGLLEVIPELGANDAYLIILHRLEGIIREKYPDGIMPEALMFELMLLVIGQEAVEANRYMYYDEGDDRVRIPLDSSFSYLPDNLLDQTAELLAVDMPEFAGEYFDPDEVIETLLRALPGDQEILLQELNDTQKLAVASRLRDADYLITQILLPENVRAALGLEESTESLLQRVQEQLGEAGTEGQLNAAYGLLSGWSPDYGESQLGRLETAIANVPGEIRGIPIPNILTIFWQYLNLMKRHQAIFSTLYERTSIEEGTERRDVLFYLQFLEQRETPYAHWDRLFLPDLRLLLESKLEGVEEDNLQPLQGDPTQEDPSLTLLNIDSYLTRVKGERFIDKPLVRFFLEAGALIASFFSDKINDLLALGTIIKDVVTGTVGIGTAFAALELVVPVGLRRLGRFVGTLGRIVAQPLRSARVRSILKQVDAFNQLHWRVRFELIGRVGEGEAHILAELFKTSDFNSFFNVLSVSDQVRFSRLRFGRHIFRLDASEERTLVRLLGQLDAARASRFLSDFEKLNELERRQLVGLLSVDAQGQISRQALNRFGFDTIDISRVRRGEASDLSASASNQVSEYGELLVAASSYNAREFEMVIDLDGNLVEVYAGDASRVPNPFSDVSGLVVIHSHTPFRTLNFINYPRLETFYGVDEQGEYVQLVESAGFSGGDIASFAQKGAAEERVFTLDLSGEIVEFSIRRGPNFASDYQRIYTEISHYQGQFTQITITETMILDTEMLAFKRKEIRNLRYQQPRLYFEDSEGRIIPFSDDDYTELAQIIWSLDIQALNNVTRKYGLTVDIKR